MVSKLIVFFFVVLLKKSLKAMNNLKIIDYNPKLSKYFYELNIEWLKTYFYVEPYDEEVLSKPGIYITGKGGYIFFAQVNNTIVGTVALMPTNKKGSFELTKMAVSPEFRGHKIGQQVIKHCIDFAHKKKLNKLILYSNRILENAIYIYKKYGFVEIPMEKNSPYKRGDIKMELIFKN